MKAESRLLIVDDNAATRYALRRRLERNGFTVFEAGTGTEGLQQIADLMPDALILDVNLPDMSGFDIVRQLRKEARTALLPVVHVSAASIQSGDIITGLEAGADAYLTHPVEPDVLLATIRTLLRVRDTEFALRESQEHFREIFVTVSAPIAVMDGDLKVHDANHAFARLISPDMANGDVMQCFSTGQDEAVGGLLHALKNSKRWRGTLALTTNGGERETEWQVSPINLPVWVWSSLKMLRSIDGASSGI